MLTFIEDLQKYIYEGSEDDDDGESIHLIF